MLSVGVTGLRRETGRHWHLAVINEVTFPTAPAAIEKNLFHFKVTSGGCAEERWGWWTDRRTDGWLRRSVGFGRSVGTSRCSMRTWPTVSDAENCGAGAQLLSLYPLVLVQGENSEVRR